MLTSLGLAPSADGKIAWYRFTGCKSYRSGMSRRDEVAAYMHEGATIVCCEQDLSDVLLESTSRSRVIVCDPNQVQARLGVDRPSDLGVRLAPENDASRRAFYCAYLGHLVLNNAGTERNGLSEPAFSVADLLKDQERISHKVSLSWDGRPVQRIGGVDQAFTEGSMISAIVVVDPNSMETVETVTATVPISFPYIPGLLSYREAPGISASLRELDMRPDVLLVNGCGINHFQGVGLASHVGVTEDIPTIGVTRRLLCGRFSSEGECGPWPIHYKSGIVGNAVASRKGSRPVFVAPGHLMDLKRSLELTLPLFTGSRLPLPLAEAHRVCTLKKKSL